MGGLFKCGTGSARVPGRVAQGSARLPAAFASRRQVAPEEGVQYVSAYVERKFLQSGFHVQIGSLFPRLFELLKYCVCALLFGRALPIPISCWPSAKSGESLSYFAQGPVDRATP